MGITPRIILGALIAVLLQIVVAPNIAILGAQPNFIVVYAIVVAMIHPSDTSLLVAFFTGLVYDALTSQPLGLTALILVAATFIFGKIYHHFGSSSVAIPLLVSILCSLLVEVLGAAAFTALTETSTTLFQAIAFRAAPCALYDSAFVLLALPLLARSLDNTEDAVPWRKNL